MHRLLIGLGVLLCGLAVSPIHAQGGPDACPTFVDDALTAVETICRDLDRDTACYGHDQVAVTFWEAQADFTFSQPADSVPVSDLHTIATSPLDDVAATWGIAALHVQADVPATLPGQAVTFLLMGDASLENAVPPADKPVTAAASAITGANLRSAPTTNANIAGSVSAGTDLILTGTSADGGWYAVQQPGATAWIYAPLVEAADSTALADLPVLTGDAPAYGPMQAFYFTTGLGAPACHTAPNGLVVQSPQEVATTLTINDQTFTIGSTVLFTTTQITTADGPVTVMVAALFEGRVETTVNGADVVLDRPLVTTEGETPVLAITLNADGRVDDTSELVTLEADALGPLVSGACAVSQSTGLLTDAIKDLDCSAPLAITVMDNTAENAPAGAPASSPDAVLAGIGANDACTIAPSSNVNLRTGPGTAYETRGFFLAGTNANPDGFASDTGGQRWWHIPGRGWVRADLVGIAGACEALGIVATPPPPAPENTPAPSGGLNPDGSATLTIENQCGGGDRVLITGPTTTEVWVPGNATIQVSVAPGTYNIVAIFNDNGCDVVEGEAYGVQIPPYTFFTACPPANWCNPPE
jgi:uncharacterized protein YgiM (DUF1202 family)